MLNEFRSTYITWDKATSRIYSTITANESDENGRKLVVQIVNSGQVEDLTGATLHLYWETRDKLHDGLDVFKAVDLEKGEFELSYTAGMLSNKGVLNANLVLINTTGRVVSERFKITVTEGINNDKIESEDSFTSLTRALIDISNLEQNYAPRLNDLTAQLQQNTTEINKSRINLTSNPNVRPLVTFIDDDGSASVWTKLKPIFESRGVPYTIALLVDYLKAGGALTVSQALELQNDLGWEVASHGMQQVQLNDLTENEVIYQLSESKNQLKNLGFNVQHYVYGYGYPNQTTRNLTRKYYKSGANAQDDGRMGINTIPIQQYKLNRTGLGVYNDGRTLDDYKARVDKAIAENGWLIFMTHIGETDTQGVSDIESILDYIISKGVEVVTLEQGFEVFGNSLFLGDFTGNYHNEKYHIVAKNGEEFKNLPKPPNVNVNTPLNNFKIGETNHTFLAVDNSGFPGGNNNGAGTLFTHRNTHPDIGFSYQIFTHYTGDIYRRRATSSTTWSTWEQIITKTTFDKYSQDIASEKNVYSNASLPSEFPNWKITSFYFDSAGKEGFPVTAGIVTTYKVNDQHNKGFTRQELRQYASNAVWSRYENATDGTWSEWVKISAV